MPEFLRHNWPAITIGVTAVAIACAAIVVLSNMPPRVIVMATGPEGDTYHDIGQRYRAVLARANVEVQLVPTAGSVENLASLLNANSRVNVALIEGGIFGARDTSGVERSGRSSTSHCGGFIGEQSKPPETRLCATAKFP